MTDTSRRTLLRASAFGVALAPLVPAWLSPATAATNLYSKRRFKSLEGKRFTLTGAGRRWRVTLAEVRGDKHCFDLTFDSRAGGPEQGTYTLKRRRFAATRLFLVPCDASRRRHLAVVNRAR